MLGLKAHNLGIVLITHRLDEVEAIADRVVVMRNGRVVHRMDSPKGRRGEIVRNMIGRDLSTVPRRAPETTKPPGEVVLDIRNLTVEDPDVPGKMVVDGLNLTLRAGEIHGLYGLVGAGRTEAARAIFGDWRGEVRGEVRLLGRDHRPRDPREAIRMGVTLLTEDRKATGILPGHSLGTNLSAASLGAVSRRGLISDGEEHERNIAMMRKLDVRPCDTTYRIENLNGGNQQKVLFGAG
ncbi:ATP-binding cassette domain-containing protein [Amaricoccus solimangrovi]|uniref:Sugar ABC transporter ATP-binding protein n=1 Tax=Amaricoccus solimangrovi TaxID=2589815 RepID=A0A501WFD9_9RHOB|nr:ATP-binding cassette domain-containing protein [Amaricoccus solimangrovi]TPE45697.1 sugar ABC transporter ATP-binding protein [Amaricoccus solimangrovi]